MNELGKDLISIGNFYFFSIRLKLKLQDIDLAYFANSGTEIYRGHRPRVYLDYFISHINYALKSFILTTIKL